MAEIVVNHVLTKLTDAVLRKAVSLYEVRDKIESIQRELKWIRAFVKDADSKRHKNNRVKCWLNEVRGVSYLIEDTLNEFLTKVGGTESTLKKIGKIPMKLYYNNKLGVKIDKILQRLNEISANTNKYKIEGLDDSITVASSDLVVRPLVIPGLNETEVVGFEHDMGAIFEQLVDTNVLRRSVLPIVGAGGFGKTTLAKKIYERSMSLLINVFYGGQILNTPTGVYYDISAACTLPVDDRITLEELRRQIHVGLQLLPSRFNLKIRAWINAPPPGYGNYYYTLFWVDCEQTWEMIKSAACPVADFRTLELVVESEPVPNPRGDYDPFPNSIPSSSNRFPDEETAHTSSREDPLPVEDPTPAETSKEEFENWHLDEEDADGDADNGDDLTMEDIEDEIDVENIIKEWQSSSRGLQHPCRQFRDGQPMPVADEPFYRRVIRTDTEFSPGQQFASKRQLRSKLAEFHLPKNISLETVDSNKVMYVVKCKDPNCRWRLYARVNDTGTWQISTLGEEHACYENATRLDHEQLTARLVADTIKEQLTDNTEMSVRLKFPPDVGNYFPVVVNNLKFPPNLSTPEALLLLLKCICHAGIAESYLENIKHIQAIKTNLGFRMPTESVLPLAEWDGVFTAIDGIPLLDVQFYGEREIRSYSEALRKLGVAVRSEEMSKVVILRFKQLVSSLPFQKNKVVSVLECLRQLKAKQNMLPADLVACMKKEKWVQTKMGLRAPAESVLFSAEWDLISSIASVPFIEYSSDVEEYKNELRALGVAVTLKQGAGFVLKGINLPTDPTTIDPSSFIMLLRCIMYWNECKKTELLNKFKGCIKKKWVKTVLGYRYPDETLLFDAKYSSLIERGDGPFIDEEFYGSEIAQYKDQLKEIGVKVDIGDWCSLVARHLNSHSEGSTITRIYKFLKKFQWKPENQNLSLIWIPSEHGEGNWVCSDSCVLHDNGNLFASQLHVLDKFYEGDLLGFFSVAFDVKVVPDVEEYVNLWELWENSASQVSVDDCLAFWEFIGMHWHPNCETLLIEHVKKLPVLMNGGISLVGKQDVFIPDDLLLEELFNESLFVWYPAKCTHSLPRSKLTRMYNALGVRKFSEAVEKHESFASSENGTAVKSNTDVVKEGLLRIILAFLANPSLDISDKERHEIVGSLFNLTIIKADEPVHMDYKITLSGGRQLEAKTTPLFRWERNESRLLMRCVDEVQGMEGRIKYATYLADEISRGLLHDRADLVESLAEIIKVGYLLDYDMAAVGFLLKNNNLRVFAEDEEFLLLHINKALPTQY